jgi:hypothetical protein
MLKFLQWNKPSGQLRPNCTSSQTRVQQASSHLVCRSGDEPANASIASYAHHRTNLCHNGDPWVRRFQWRLHPRAGMPGLATLRLCFLLRCEGAAGGFDITIDLQISSMDAARERRVSLDGCLLVVNEAPLASRPLEGSREV